MCISKTTPIKKEAGIGYAVKRANKGAKSVSSVIKYSTQRIGQWTKARDKTEFYWRGAKPENIGFHIFTNKKHAKKFKNMMFEDNNVVVKLQYRKGMYAGVIDNCGHANGLPCITAKEIKILEILK